MTTPLLRPRYSSCEPVVWWKRRTLSVEFFAPSWVHRTLPQLLPRTSQKVALGWRDLFVPEETKKKLHVWLCPGTNHLTLQKDFTSYSCSLWTGSGWEGLFTAGRAEKKLANSEVAEGFRPVSPSPHPGLESLFTGSTPITNYSCWFTTVKHNDSSMF